jgi:hypothetical protein
VKRPVQPPRLRIEAEQLVASRDDVGIRAGAKDVSRRPVISRGAASDRVFPDDLPGGPLEGVYVTDSRPISADENQAIGDERVAVETRLLPVLFDVVAPPLLPGLLIEGVEGAGAGADEYKVPGDRRCGPDSTARLILPQDARVRGLRETYGIDGQQRKSQDGRSIRSHRASYYSQYGK